MNELNTELDTLLKELDLTSEDPNYLTDNITRIYQSLSDKYMPYKKLTRKEKRFYYKPWITRGIKKSMKTRDHLRNKMNKDKTGESEIYYKKYKNFVSRLQNESYNNYYSKKVSKTFKNKKKLWETIGEITKYKKRQKSIS